MILCQTLKENGVKVYGFHLVIYGCIKNYPRPLWFKAFTISQFLFQESKHGVFPVRISDRAAVKSLPNFAIISKFN